MLGDVFAQFRATERRNSLDRTLALAACIKERPWRGEIVLEMSVRVTFFHHAFDAPIGAPLRSD